jgi:hypothetical protein
MVGQIAATRIDFRSNKFLNDHWGRESVAYVAEIDGFAVPVRFEVVIGVKKFVGPQFTIIEVVGDRLTDRRYVLDVRMQDGKVSAGLFDQWLVNSPDVTDPDVIRFLKRIVEKGREATRRDFTLAAA